MFTIYYASTLFLAFNIALMNFKFFIYNTVLFFTSLIFLSGCLDNRPIYSESENKYKRVLSEYNAYTNSIKYLEYCIETAYESKNTHEASQLLKTYLGKNPTNIIFIEYYTTLVDSMLKYKRPELTNTEGNKVFGNWRINEDKSIIFYNDNINGIYIDKNEQLKKFNVVFNVYKRTSILVKFFHHSNNNTVHEGIPLSFPSAQKFLVIVIDKDGNEHNMLAQVNNNTLIEFNDYNDIRTFFDELLASESNIRFVFIGGDAYDVFYKFEIDTTGFINAKYYQTSSD